VQIDTGVSACQQRPSCALSYDLDSFISPLLIRRPFLPWDGIALRRSACLSVRTAAACHSGAESSNYDVKVAGARRHPVRNN